jgi:hypothetical protein
MTWHAQIVGNWWNLRQGDRNVYYKLKCPPKQRANEQHATIRWSTPKFVEISRNSAISPGRLGRLILVETLVSKPQQIKAYQIRNHHLILSPLRHADTARPITSTNWPIWNLSNRACGMCGVNRMCNNGRFSQFRKHNNGNILDFANLIKKTHCWGDSEDLRRRREYFQANK